MGVLPGALEIGRQLEFREGQVVLILNKPLELGEPFERCHAGSRRQARNWRRTAPCTTAFLVIGVLVLEIDFGVERSGEIGGQIARILRADGDTGAEGPAFAGEVFEMRAAWPRATPRPARAGA